MTKISYILGVVSMCGVMGAGTLTACTITSTDSTSDAGVTNPGKDSGSGSDAGNIPPADTGTGANPDTGTAGGQCDEVLVFAGTCDECLSKNCGPSFCECFASRIDAGADNDCNLQDDCFANCIQADGGTNAVCLDACGQAHPKSKDLYAAFQKCSTEKCATECR